MGAQDGRVDPIVLLSGDGNVGGRFNLVIVAEGYRDADLATFADDAKQVVDRLKDHEPFASHLAAFNVFRLDVASTEAGADQGTSKVATYFDAHFAVDPPQLLLVDNDLVVTTVGAALSDPAGVAAPVHKIIVLVNTDTDGGAGGVADGIAVASRAEGERTVLHELGHVLGLVDEYADADPDTVSMPKHLLGLPAASAQAVWPNRSLTFDKAELPAEWAALIKPGTPLPTIRPTGSPALPRDTVGAFPDLNSSYYRPQAFCAMRDPKEEFCQVCAAYMIMQISKPNT